MMSLPPYTAKRLPLLLCFLILLSTYVPRYNLTSSTWAKGGIVSSDSRSWLGVYGESDTGNADDVDWGSYDFKSDSPTFTTNQFFDTIDQDSEGKDNGDETVLRYGGYKISGLYPGGPAERAGLKQGHIILTFGKTVVKSWSDIRLELHHKTPGDKISILVVSDDKVVSIEVTLGELPSNRLVDLWSTKEGVQDMTKDNYLRRPMPTIEREIPIADLVKMGAACGQGVRWQTQFDEALAEAERRQCPVLWSIGHDLEFNLQKPDYFVVPDSAQAETIQYDINLRMTLFHYESTVNMINRKYVALRMLPSARRAETYGLHRGDFVEPGIIFLAPDGSLLHITDRISTYSEQFFYSVLQSVLKQHPNLDSDSLELQAARAKVKSMDLTNESKKHWATYMVALEEFYGGDLEAATATLQPVLKSPVKHRLLPDAILLQVEIDRMQGKFDSAIERLQVVREMIPQISPQWIEMMNLWMVTLLRQGDLKAASEKCDELFRPLDAAPSLSLGDLKYDMIVLKMSVSEDKYSVSSSMLLAGKIAWLQKKEDLAAAIWGDLCQFSSSNSGAIASHYLRGQGPLIHSAEQVRWLPETMLPVMPAKSSSVTKKAEQFDSMVKRSVNWLRQEQRGSGAWTDSYYVWMGAEHRHNTYMAGTALAASALLAWQQDDKATEEAISSAEKHLSDPRNFSFTSVEKVYAFAYMAQYFCKALQQGSDEEKEMRREILKNIIRRLHVFQDAHAGWAHEYFNPFVTAVVLIALADAKQAGIEIPKDMIENGVKALSNQRMPSGAFPYSYRDGRSLLQAEAAFSRMPICELALFLHGASSQRKLTMAMDAYFENLPTLLRVRQYDNHADKYGNAGFFFFHSLYPVSEAIQHVESKNKRNSYANTLRQLMLTLQEYDGGWVDSPELGKSYGTAMALLILKNLQDQNLPDDK